MEKGSNGVGASCLSAASRQLRCLVRRKKNEAASGRVHLARRLSVFDLVAIGVGSTIGAGVYILVGTVAREHTGPALPVSFLLAGIAAGLSAFCYAELACRCPSAGSAYHYSYICIGEGVAWLIGWSLILEFTLGGAAVARGTSPNLALFFGGQDKLPALLAHRTILGIVVDPCAAILVFIVTGLLCTGIKESSLAQAIITSINVCAMLFVFVAGNYLGFKTGWAGYVRPNRYFPFGLNGLLAGSGTLFFSYVGFDCLTSTAEEVRNPQRDLPLGIGFSLFICGMLYTVVSAVIVGLVPYYELDVDTPISAAFASYGMDWAVYIITTGAVTALCASLMGSILPQPRILMAMARDGLLPSFFSEINIHTRVPVKSTIVTGFFIGVLAFFMDVSQLAGMVSVGTLLAFTIVAISVLVLRYIPPLEVPIPLSHQPPVGSVTYLSVHDIQETVGDTIIYSADAGDINYHTLENESTNQCPLLQKKCDQDLDSEQRRRKIAAYSIGFMCCGVLLLASATSAKSLPCLLRLIFSGVGGLLLLGGLIVLSHTDQADARHSFGQSGGFLCPFVPYIPAVCTFINTYLLINLGAGTWIRVSVWLMVGALIYLFYGRNHSRLLDASSTPIVPAEDGNH